MNKAKIREIRDSWGNSTSIYELCNALLEDDKKFELDWDIGTALRDVYPTKQKVDGVMPAPNVDCDLAAEQKMTATIRCSDYEHGAQAERQRWIAAVRGRRFIKPPPKLTTVNFVLNQILADMGVTDE